MKFGCRLSWPKVRGKADLVHPPLPSTGMEGGTEISGGKENKLHLRTYIGHIGTCKRSQLACTLLRVVEFCLRPAQCIYTPRERDRERHTVEAVR